MEITGHTIAQTELYVQQQLAGRDGSHDWWHIHRVRQNALLLGEQEGLSPTALKLVELAALLHDLCDWKYSSTEQPGDQQLRDYLCSLQLHPHLVTRVVDIIERMGFKDELDQGSAAPVDLEFAVVQDADRLDAIGAVGIARCFTFGGKFNRVLHDPSIPPRTELSKSAYTDKTAQQTTINHFYEKLLKLKDLMKTATGRKLAQQRHDFMCTYLEQFTNEWNNTL